MSLLPDSPLATLLAHPPEPLIGTSLAELLPAALAQVPHSTLLVAVDATVLRLHEYLYRSTLPHAVLVEVPSGEQHKTLQTCQLIWSACAAANLDRQALILAIGGGMTTDLAAWCAATWKRGIRFGLVPTTLLAMVDAAHGGKTGIDFQGGKNLLGSFSRPEFVVCATEFLATLPQNELYSGYAEVLKHALIGAPNAAHLLQLNPAALSPTDWQAIVTSSAAFKLNIVRQDPLEQGLRQILNFGHTVGHAVESTLLGTPQQLLHGQAVAIGMAVEAVLSAAYDELKHREAWQLVERLRNLYPIAEPPQFDWDTCRRYLLQDKKNHNNELRMVTLAAIGRANYGRSVPVDAVIAAMREVW